MTRLVNYFMKSRALRCWAIILMLLVLEYITWQYEDFRLILVFIAIVLGRTWKDWDNYADPSECAACILATEDAPGSGTSTLARLHEVITIYKDKPDAEAVYLPGEGYSKLTVGDLRSIAGAIGAPCE